MRKYELVCIFDPQAGENSFDGLVEKYEAYLNSHGGQVVNIDRWGMRQLAYSTPSMRKRRQGYYVLYQIEAESAIVAPLEEELRIDEVVLRHLLMLVEGEFLKVPQLVPEAQIIFGPPARDRGDRGRGRERERGGERDTRRRDRDGAPPAGRPERAPAPASAPAPTPAAASDGPAAEAGAADSDKAAPESTD